LLLNEEIVQLLQIVQVASKMADLGVIERSVQASRGDVREGRSWRNAFRRKNILHAAT